MMRSLAVAVAILLTLAAPTPVQASSAISAGSAAGERAATSITGSWKGAVYNQDGPAGYTGLVHIRRTADGYAATARYEKIGRTRWAYRGRDHGWYLFRERLVGSDSGDWTAVRVRRDGARLVVRWRIPMSDYTGHMRARRVG